MIGTTIFHRFGLIAILVAFSVLAVINLASDLWFDEVFTISNFVLTQRIGDIFSEYYVANNHMLYSAVLYTWLSLVPYVNEIVTRLPSYFFGLGTILVMFRVGTLFLDRSAGIYMALLMAFSPVFLSFFYQVRGYGLTMLLASLATLGTLHLAEGRRCRGLWLYGPAVLLLPSVIPTNVLLNGSLWLFLVFSAVCRGQWRKQIPVLFALGVLSVAGIAIYVPVWDQLVYVAVQTKGWESGTAVLGHWLLALLAHAGLLVLVYPLLIHKITPKTSSRTTATVRSLPLLFACCFVPLAVVALWVSPYPRSLLVYLPACHICTFYTYRPIIARRPVTLLLLVTAVLTNTLICTQLAAAKTRTELAKGHYPQNLIQQYYYQSDHLSTTTQHIAEQNLATAQTRIYVDFHLFPTCRYYWVQQGRDPRQFECLQANPLHSPLYEPSKHGWAPQLILAYCLEKALADYRQITGYTVDVEALDSPTMLRIYRVIEPIRAEP